MHEKAIAVNLLSLASCTESLEYLSHGISVDIVVSLGSFALAHKVVPDQEKSLVTFTDI